VIGFQVTGLPAAKAFAVNSKPRNRKKQIPRRIRARDDSMLCVTRFVDPRITSQIPRAPARAAGALGYKAAKCAVPKECEWDVYQRLRRNCRSLDSPGDRTRSG